MDPAVQVLIVELTKAFGGIITDLKWPLVVSLFLYLTRDALSAFVKRLINFDFKWGKAQGSLRAEPCPQDSLLLTTAAETESPPKLEEQSQIINEVKGDKLFSEMHSAFLDGRPEDGRRAFESYQETITDPKERLRTRALYLHLNYIHGGSAESLAQLEQIFSETTDPEDREDIVCWLAWCYSSTRNFPAERDLWQNMLDASTEADKRAGIMRNLVTSLTNLQQFDVAKELLITEIRRSSTVPKALAILYNVLANLEQKHGDAFVAAIAYDKAIQFSPQDTDVMFSAAYAQSQCELNYCSYINYDTLLRLRSDKDMAANNIGVQAAELAMPGRSVTYYKKAMDLGNTLAMANLAYLYMNAGFLLEAQNTLQEAMKDKEPHPNVSAAITELDKKKKAEQETHKTSINTGSLQQDFIRAYADARFLKSDVENILSIDNTWITEYSTEIVIKSDKNSFESSWEDMGSAIGISKYFCSIQGTIINRSIMGSFSTKPKDGGILLTALGETSNRKYIGFISENGRELKIMFRDTKSPMFYLFKKKQ